MPLHVGIVEDANRERDIPAWAWAVPPGEFDTRVLDQDRIWVTGDAEVLRLGEMSTAHLVAVQAMLARRTAEGRSAQAVPEHRPRRQS